MLALAALVGNGPPNVVIVVADDVGIDAIGIYGEGGDLSLTPNIDRLVASGVLFRNAYGAPICSPSRAMLLTGRYPDRTGLGDILIAPEGGFDACVQHDLNASERTLPEILRQTPEPYTSAAFGKWHLNAACLDNGGLDAPRVRGGFAHFAGALSNFAPRSQGVPTDSHFFCWPKIVDGVNDCEGNCCTGSYTGGAGQNYRAVYATTDNVDDALSWIGAQAPAQSWLCYLAFHAAHVPLQAPPQALHDRALVYPVGDPLAGSPVPEGTIAADLEQTTGGVIDDQAYFQASLQALDRELGRLVAALPVDTVVIFVGDNGTMDLATSAPFDPFHAKGTSYEGGVRVPLIVSGRTVVAPQRTSDALVSLVDLYATVADLTGAPLPVGVTVDGISFAPILLDPFAPAPRSSAFTAHFRPNDDPLVPPDPPRTLEVYTLRNARYKLIVNDVPLAPDELYDLELDPFEQCDIVAFGGLTGQALVAYNALKSELAQLRATFP